MRNKKINIYIYICIYFCILNSCTLKQNYNINTKEKNGSEISKNIPYFLTLNFNMLILQIKIFLVFFKYWARQPVQPSRHTVPGSPGKDGRVEG